MSGKGKNKLIAYCQLTKGRLEKLSEAGDVDDDAFSTIVASVVTSILRLSSGAPEDVRDQLRTALETGGCLDGGAPNPACGTEGLGASLDAVLEALGAPQEDEDPDQDEDERLRVDVEPGEEAETLAGAVSRLWEIEQPFRLQVGTDVVLNEQHRADFDPIGEDPRTVTDRATEPLFASVDRSKFSKVDHAFMALLDNYTREGDVKEDVTAEERGEMDRFMDLLDETPHMRYVHKVLVKWDLAPPKLRDFMAQVYDAWFTNYYRGTSSGFEHVFVGEEKKNRKSGKSEIIGLHNWIQFAREEARGNINYLGYAHKGSADGEMVTVRFAWLDDDPEIEVKPCSTFLVGPSVAFEFSLACLVFFGGQDGDKPWVTLGEHDVAIQLYKVRDRFGEYVRTVYLE